MIPLIPILHCNLNSSPTRVLQQPKAVVTHYHQQYHHHYQQANHTSPTSLRFRPSILPLFIPCPTYPILSYTTTYPTQLPRPPIKHVHSMFVLHRPLSTFAAVAAASATRVSSCVRTAASGSPLSRCRTATGQSTRTCSTRHRRASFSSTVGAHGQVLMPAAAQSPSSARRCGPRGGTGRRASAARVRTALCWPRHRRAYRRRHWWGGGY